ncbi:hypothetical protein BCR35DRAFT_355350 [Leucosporidium creatinivorum]|uniref:C3H1-type domain-containing protein n=1 Tax=Leucosporidium creatinivorum TaxID=106004 RepID=A0A1Y2DHP0_9BASI|nr:hypothetical protein BCR35DRAFT_355350 [Leucosporidium creatinivorum]
MALHALSDSTSEGTTQHSPTSPTGPSSRYGDLIALDAHIARLELQTRTQVGQSSSGGGATTVEEGGSPYVLAIIDEKQVCRQGDGFIAGMHASKEMEQLVLAGLAEVEAPSKPEALVYLISDLSKSKVNRLDHLEDFTLGFNEAGPFAAGLVVSSETVAIAKAAALLRLHGASSSCLRIILGARFSSLTNSIETMSIFTKVDYLEEGFLLGSSEEPVEEQSAQAPHRQRCSPIASRSSTAIPTPWADDEHNDAAVGNGEGVRTVDPDLAIWRQDPPICHNFVLLSECPHGETCRFGHDYALSEEEVEALAQAVKRMPCDSAKPGYNRPCPFGEDCIYGHVCPYDARCTFPRCKFSDAAHPVRSALARKAQWNHAGSHRAKFGGRGGGGAGREGGEGRNWRKK